MVWDEVYALLEPLLELAEKPEARERSAGNWGEVRAAPGWRPLEEGMWFAG